MNEKQRILIIDDEPVNIRLFMALLAPRGFACLSAEGGKEGLARALAEKPDLILLDVMMPEMDGFEVCTALKADSRIACIPVILISGIGEDSFYARGRAAGADAVLQKPFRMQKFVQTIEVCLGRLKSSRG